MLKKTKEYYNWGGRFLTNPYQIAVEKISIAETKKTPTRTQVLNYLLNSFENDSTQYLEIGVRNPAHNFDEIIASEKYSVDPGIEFKENPVDFKLSSDAFFKQLNAGLILRKNIRFDVIFIDGLHLAEQVDRDIENALAFIKDDGYIVLHDCNPPTEWHAREEYLYDLTPAKYFWNGTTWKAFYKYRQRTDLTSACIDTDWGIGIITRKKIFNSLTTNNNPFFEFKVLEKNRVLDLNLINFDELKMIIEQNKTKGL